MDAAEVDIILLNPPVRDDYFFKTEHLGLAYLAGSLEVAGFTSLIIDAQLEALDALHCLLRLRDAGEPRLFLAATTVSDYTTRSTFEIVAALRASGWRRPLVLGGFDATLHHRLITPRLSEGDVVVLGDGEDTVCSLARRASAGDPLPGSPGTASRAGLGDRPVKVDLDRVPPPRRDGLRASLQLGLPPVVAASRGCFGMCRFCTIQDFHATSVGGPYRARSPGNVVEEIRRLREANGLRYVFFVDDTFIGPGAKGAARALELAERVQEAGITRWTMQCRVDQVDPDLFAALRGRGLESLFMGVESCIPRAMREFGKGDCEVRLAEALAVLAALGIELLPTYIFWDPFMTFEELRLQFDFMRGGGSASPMHLHSLRVLPESALQARLEAEGRSMGVPARSPRYVQVDPRVELLCRIIEPDYQRAYLPAFDGVYRSHFAALLVDDDERRDELRGRVRDLTVSLRGQHVKFVGRLLDGLEAGDLSGIGRAYVAATERLAGVTRELGRVRHECVAEVAGQLADHDG